MKKNNYEMKYGHKIYVWNHNRNRKMKNTPHNKIQTWSVCDVLNNISSDFKVIMLRCFYVIARKPLLDERTVKLNAPMPKGGGA